MGLIEAKETQSWPVLENGSSANGGSSLDKRKLTTYLLWHEASIAPHSAKGSQERNPRRIAIVYQSPLDVSSVNAPVFVSSTNLLPYLLFDRGTDARIDRPAYLGW